MQIRKVFAAIILTLCVIACSESVPKGVLPKGKMADVLYDYHLAQSFEQPHMGPKVDVDAIMDAFYKKHDITREDLDSSLAWYSRHVDLLAEVYAELGERFNDASSSVAPNATVSSSYDVHGDTLDIWNQSRLRFLTSSKLNNHFEFLVPADTSFYMHDLFQLQFDLHFMNPQENIMSVSASETSLTVGLVVRYENDSVSASLRTVYSPQHSSLMLKADSALQIKSVSGFFGLPSKKSVPVIIDGITLQRYHTEAVEPESTDSHDEEDVVATSPDSLPAPRRLSPQEIRSSKPVERKVHIRKR